MFLEIVLGLGEKWSYSFIYNYEVKGSYYWWVFVDSIYVLNVDWSFLEVIKINNMVDGQFMLMVSFDLLLDFFIINLVLKVNGIKVFFDVMCVNYGDAFVVGGFVVDIMIDLLGGVCFFLVW